jgi:hypothetical protein
LGEQQSRSGRGDEEKNSQLPSEIEPQSPDCLARSPALYRLSYRGSFEYNAALEIKLLLHDLFQKK